MTKKNRVKFILFINTSNDKELDVFLINANGGGKVGDKRNLKNANNIIDKIIQTGDYKVTEYLLKSIEVILKNNKLKTSDLSGIMAVTGPGAFTSLRIACVVANTLAYSLNIPAVGINNKKLETNNDKLVKLGLAKLTGAKLGKYLSPFYNHQPNITIAKK
jgi:tRNA threonylcarbamoyl adenosine modification protein YeaZ